MDEMDDIWDQYNFGEIEEGTALHLLQDFIDSLGARTDNILVLETNAVDSYMDDEDDDDPKPIVSYPVYLVAPELDRYRIRLMTIVQYKLVGVFPVDILCHFDNSTYKKIDSANLHRVVGQIFSKSVVKATLENLYRRSLERRMQSSQRFAS